MLNHKFDSNRIITFTIFSILIYIQFRYKIGDPILRMAISSSDDNPLNNIQPLLNDELYKSDVLMQYNSSFAKFSIFTMFPLVLIKLDISRYFIWNLLVFLQLGFMLISLRTLVITFTRDLKVLFAVWLMVIICKPYYLNLTGLAALDDQPYAFWLAVPFAILAITNILRNRILISSIWTIFCVLTHPSTGLITLGFIIVQLSILNRPKIYRYLSITLPIVLIYIVSTRLYRLPDVEIPKFIKMQLQNNFHLVFANIGQSQNPRFALFVWLLILAISVYTAFAPRKDKLEALRKTVLLLSLTTLFLTLIQLIATHLFIYSLMSLASSRISVIFVLIGFVYIFLNELDSDRLYMRDSYGYFLTIYPSPYTIVLLTLRQFCLRKKYSKIIQAISITLLIISAHIYLGYKLIPSTSNWKIWSTWMLDLTQFDIGSMLRASLVMHKKLYVFTILALIFLFFVQGSKKIRNNFYNMKIAHLVLLIWVSLTLIWGFSYQNQFTYQSNQFSINKVKDLAKAQIWSERNTSPTANFIVTPNSTFTPWRTLSERPVIQYGYVSGMYGYKGYMDEYSKSIYKFWSKQNNHSLNAQNLCSFQSEFGGNYLVEELDGNIIKSDKLKSVYRNTNYIISLIQC